MDALLLGLRIECEGYPASEARYTKSQVIQIDREAGEVLIEENGERRWLKYQEKWVEGTLVPRRFDATDQQFT